jgi:hypothetical protein
LRETRKDVWYQTAHENVVVVEKKKLKYGKKPTYDIYETTYIEIDNPQPSS